MTTTAPEPLHSRLETARRLHNGAWVLAARPADKPGQFHEEIHAVLTFHSGAGAEAPFATGYARPSGVLIQGSYRYFATIEYALFDYTYER